MRLSSVQIQSLQSFFKDKPVSRVYVFGSFARGEADEHSDVDLLVELDNDSLKTPWEFFDMWEDVQLLLHKKVDFASKLSRHIQPVVDKEKILIYEKK